MVLQHQTLNLLVVQLHAAEDIVGVLGSWRIGPGPCAALCLRSGDWRPERSHPVNIESLLALRPQVVFVANAIRAGVIAQIQQAGIPVVASLLRQDAAGEKNEPQRQTKRAYNAGLVEGIRLIGGSSSASPRPRR